MIKRASELRPVGTTILDTKDRTKRLRIYVPAIIVLIVGGALSLGVFAVLTLRSGVRQRSAFERRATEIAGALIVGFELPIEVLHSVPALFDASEGVSRDEFRVFTAGALRRYPGIYALEWLPIVNAADRAAFEAAARADGLVGFQFTEDAGGGVMTRAADRPFYLPIYYMEPPNEVALGFDVASEPDRFAPVERAALTGSTVASPRIRLVEDDPSVYSIAVFHPVYRPGASLSNGEERRAALRGVAAEVFRVAPMVQRALRLVDTEEVNVTLLDESAPPETGVLFANEEWPESSGTPARQLQHSIEIPFADRRWLIEFRAEPGFAADATLRWTVLAVGALLSILFAVGIGAYRNIVLLRRQMQAALQLGQYTLEERIGEGGMGVVFRARHAMLRRATAIKLLPPGKSGEERLARFEREVQLTSQLRHPNTIAIYDYGRTSEGVLYYVMEYIDGISFGKLVEKHGPQPAARVAFLLGQVCGALAEAHAAGLVHRDVKPANLMLCIQGGLSDFVKVLDFGLVKEAGDVATGLSQPGMLLGTPLYLAPEAIRSPDQVEPRSDLYALGAVGYYLLCGEPVFAGDNVIDICRQHLHDSPIPPSRRAELTVPESIERVIMRCLSKEPRDRYGSAADLGEALDACECDGSWTYEDARAWWQLHEPARFDAARQPGQARP